MYPAWATLRHSPIEFTHRGFGGRLGEGSEAQQQRKEEAEAGQEQEERRRGALTVQTRHLVHEPIRQEALGLAPSVPAHTAINLRSQVVWDAAKLKATINQAACELTYGVGWAFAAGRQPSAQGKCQLGAAVIERRIDHRADR